MSLTIIGQALAKSRVLNGKALEDRLSDWAAKPSDTEQEKCARAVRMVKAAIDKDPKLSKMNISIYAKGSFANRTNIPSDSDVDIAVEHNEVLLNEYPEGKDAASFGLISSPITFDSFRTDVFTAIQNEFGKTEAIPDEKCIKIRSNSCRVDADVVPHFGHRRYKDDGSFYKGVALVAKDKRVYNWPQQDYDRGVQKNSATSKKYKGQVRILKNIRTEMIKDGYNSADSAKSYLISCLMFNVPDAYFNNSTNTKTILLVLNYLIEQTANATMVDKWVEVSGMKWLFRPSQSWSVSEINTFLKDAKSYLESLA